MSSRWNDLSETYKHDGLVLVLGAGSSYGSKLPMWRDLVRQVANVCADMQEKVGKKTLIDHLLDSGTSLTSIASVLKARLGENRFHEVVRATLYANLPFRGKALRNCRADLLSNVERNTTLQSIAELCIIEDANRYVRNPKIHAIVNFNLDSIFRSYMEARYPSGARHDLLVRTIERACEDSELHKIGVYHPHGYLRFDHRAGESRKENESIVLTEADYYDFMNRPTSFFTYTFLHLLRDHHCLFVGCSMSDENIRRLLHFSRAERIQAYIEKKKPISSRLSSTKKRACAKALRHFAVLQEQPHQPLQRFTEESLGLLGTQVLWVRDFEKDLPRRLKALRDGESPRNGYD